MSSDAGHFNLDNSRDSKESHQHDATDSSGSSPQQIDQDGSDISGSNTGYGSGSVNNLEDQQSPSERSEQLETNERSSEPGPMAAGAFSMAQALSMIRQKRELEQRTAEAKEEEIQAQRLEKVRERRRRQRRNQRLRKAQLKLERKDLKDDSKSSPQHQPQEPPDLSTPAPNQDRHAIAGQAEPYASDELKRTHESAAEAGDAMLKRLPVKKRIKLESANHLLAKDKPAEGLRNYSDNEDKLEGPKPGCASSKPPATVAVNGNSGPSQINRLIPRALLLKMGKASKET